MTARSSRNHQRLRLVAALLAAVLIGFGLARLTGGPADKSTVETPHSHDAKHDDHDDHDHGDDNDEHDHDEEGRIHLTEQQIAASGIDIVTVGRGGGSEVRLSGRVEAAVGSRAAVAASISGRVERILVAPGDRIESGQTLALVVSGDAAALRAQADAAHAQAESARLRYQRDQSLEAQGVIARQELEASRAQSLAADASARAAAAQITAAGTPDRQGRITITSPVPGVVNAIEVTPGRFVAAGDLIAHVAEPTRTELVLNAPAVLATRIRPGMRIEASAAGVHFTATVLAVATDVREQGSATIVRAEAAAGRMPAIGSPVAGIVVTDEHDSMLTVPADSVQTVAGNTVVFVADDEGFLATPVLTGRRANEHIEIVSGLTGSERIVGRNAFLLKAELAKGEATHDH